MHFDSDQNYIARSVIFNEITFDFVHNKSSCLHLTLVNNLFLVPFSIPLVSTSFSVPISTTQLLDKPTILSSQDIGTSI